MFTLKKQLLIFLAHLKQLQRLRNCGIFLLIYNNSYWMSGASICSVKSMFRHDLRSCSAIWASGAAQQGPSFGDVTFSGTRSKSRKKIQDGPEPSIFLRSRGCWDGPCYCWAKAGCTLGSSAAFDGAVAIAPFTTAPAVRTDPWRWCSLAQAL